MSAEHPALAGLYDVPWATVEHAYGPATDVPSLLVALTGSRDQQERAMYELHGNIWHQGTVYEATSYAVPFLARLVLTEPPPLRDEVLNLIADIATGSSYLDVHQDLVRDAVRDWLPDLIAKVRASQTPGALALICRLAAAYPDDKERFTEPLQWMWENVHDLRLRAALGIALARRSEPAEYADQVLCDLYYDLDANPRANDT
jgi:hypothetical protein